MNFHRRLATFLALMLASPLQAQDAPASAQSFGLSPGPYQVGFGTLQLSDSTRYTDVDPTITPGPREITALVWYPAGPNPPGGRMVYGDYVRLDAVRLGFRPITENWESVIENRLLMSYGSDGLTRERLDHELASATWAFRDARPAAGSFPLVLYSPGGRDPAWDNSVMAEYLASHGFVVASVPSRGWYSSILPYPTGLVGSAAMAADLETVRQRLRSWPNVDSDRVAVMGFSRGGITNALMQMRDPSIGALVGLDGTIAYRYRFDPVPWSDPATTPGSLEASGFGQPHRLDVPFLWIGANPPDEFRTSFEMDPLFLFWDELRYSTAYRVEFQQLQHQDFSSAVIRLAPEVAEIGSARSQELKNRSYESVALYVRHFLDGYLKDDDTGIDFLNRSPEENGLAPGTVRVERRRPVGPAPTLSAFRTLLERRGFAAAETIVQDILDADPTWTLPEHDLTNWGWTILADGRCGDAVSLLRMAEQLYTESSEVKTVLGEAHVALGDRQEGARSYREAVRLSSGSPLATERLSLLEAGESLPEIVRCN